MSSHKAPSAGQKVQPRSNPPISTENPGSIDPSSLAAESLRSGGAFKANPNAHPGAGPTVDPRASKPGTSGKAGAANPDSLANQESYAGVAPGYVSTTQAGKGDGPHGRNLTEGGFAGSGTSGGRLPEPGSRMDPSRGVVKNFRGVGGEGKDGGEGGKRKVVGDEQPFGALGRDTSA